MKSILLIFYVIPTVICLIADIHNIAQDIKNDIRKRGEQYYNPTVTIAYLLGRVLWTLIPVLNILKALKYIITDFMEILISIIDKVLTIPLIPKKKN